MTYTIREARLSDAEAIRRLNETEMGYCLSLEATRENLSGIIGDSSHKIFVACTETAVAGYIHACGYDLIYAPHQKNIMGLAVDSSFKRQGIGSALFARVEMWARETGAASVRLSSGASRTAAHEFYHKCGCSGDRTQLTMEKIL